ncbi:MAG: hypothetical protein SangKO_036510 [Sandaracinaceae bacterium]
MISNHNHRSLLAGFAALLTCSLAGCMAAEDTVAAENALRNEIDVTFIAYDRASETFTLGIELDQSVLEDPSVRYLVAQLFYTPPGDAGVSPFTGTPIGEVELTRVGRARYAGELYVPGPRPGDLEDVVARVSGAPTPHP